MRYRILASFQGAPYEAGIGPDESDVVLFAACPPPEELRFEPATGHWRKRVNRGEVQTLYESRPVGMFRGERCVVLDDLSDRLHIVYLGHDALRAAELGYWEVDRGVFELITPRHEVTDIVEQRRPLPIRGDGGQHTRPEPMPPERPDELGAVGANGMPYSAGDSQPLGYGSGGHDGFATGPQLFHQRASLDGLPPSYSQDLPITGLPRSEPGVAKPADQSEVAIPPVPEPPLPLEAEALRAASSAARRGQKSSQSRQAPPTAPTQVPVEPVQAASAPAEAAIAPASAGPAPASAGPAPVSAAAAPPQVAIKEVEVRMPAAEVSQPLPAPVTAAAMLSKAAMLSHAAATAARQAASRESSTRGKQESEPRAAMPTIAGLTPVPAMAQRRREEPEQPGSTPDRTSMAPEHASLSPEPAPLPAAPAPPPEPAAQVSPEPASLPAEPAPPPEPAKLSPAQAGAPAKADAAGPVPQAADAVAHADQPATEQIAASGPVDAQAHDSARRNQSALSDTVASAPYSAPARPAADSPPYPVPVLPAPSPSPGEDGPTSPGSAEPASAQPAEPAATQSAEPAPAQPAEPATTASAQAAPDHADAAVGTPLAGISDPPSVAHPPAASAVPSWVPQGPVQPQPGYDAAHPVPPTHDIMPSQAGYFAPYVPSESVSRNGTAANGAAAAVDLGLTTPMPIQQPGRPPSSTLLAQPGPIDSLDAIAEPAPAPRAETDAGGTTRRRRSTKRRLPTQKIFSDLATQAAIPAAAYAIGEDVDGAMCLVRTDEGFEVFNAVGGARHEVRVFQDEESAYFYLFGVLVAESVRTGALVPRD